MTLYNFSYVPHAMTLLEPSEDLSEDVHARKRAPDQPCRGVVAVFDKAIGLGSGRPASRRTQVTAHDIGTVAAY
jgi:hypothetical protein